MLISKEHTNFYSRVLLNVVDIDIILFTEYIWEYRAAFELKFQDTVFPLRILDASQGKLKIRSQAAFSVSFLTSRCLSLGTHLAAGNEHGLPQGPAHHLVQNKMHCPRLVWGSVPRHPCNGFALCLSGRRSDPCLGLDPVQSLDIAEVCLQFNNLEILWSETLDMSRYPIRRNWYKWCTLLLCFHGALVSYLFLSCSCFSSLPQLRD